VILVSHDRAFLDNVVTQSIVFAGEGRLLELPGGYADWLGWRARQGEDKAAAKPASARPAPAATPAKPRKSGLSYKEQKELDALPEQIAALETEQADLARQLSDPAVYADHTRAAALNARGTEIEEALLELLARWEALEGKA
jgi:ATP-binding cassette subfamily F protein uup